MGSCEYDNQFGKFRIKENRGYLYQIEPRMSLTAAAADKWICSEPGKEGLIALLIAESLSKNNNINNSNLNKFKKLAGIGNNVKDLNNSNVDLSPNQLEKQRN